jgi:receptor-type tyrosine-protein phosphatase gamma
VTAYNTKEIDKFPAFEEFNVPKNRLEDLIPMTTKRVPLPTKPGIQGSDYINATYLQVILVKYLHVQLVPIASKV